MTTIYHMAAAADWQAALQSGSYAGTPDDQRDGFLHFSTKLQVAESARKHRAGRTDLVLLTVRAEALGEALKWEPARGGQLFPHLYGPLRAADVARAESLPLGPDGLHEFPWDKPTPGVFPTRLTDGYRSFLDGRFTGEQARYEMLARAGQRPEIMVIGCVDSRVSPEVIFDASPGELLVVRNVANIVPKYEPDAEGRNSQHGTSAALEFGVQALRVKHIVVLGHAFCGGIRAFADDNEPLSPGDFIGKWMAQIKPAADSLGPRGRQDFDAYLNKLEFASVELSLQNLMTFPCVRVLVERGKLALHGAYFGVSTGMLLVRDAATGNFAPVTGDAPGRLPLMRAGI